MGIGILAASSSFAAQGISAICWYCTIAATIFAIAGLIELSSLAKINLLYLVAIGPLFIALAVYSQNGYEDPRSFTYVQAQESELVSDYPDKPRLYISSSCKACKDAMLYFVDKDPDGQHWQPVIVPNISLAKGEEILRNIGYTGKVISAGRSPAGSVPCLVLENQEPVRGSKKAIQKWESYLQKRGW